MYNEYQEFLYAGQARKLSPSTMKNHRNITRAFLDFLKDDLKINDVEDIRKIHIQQYLRFKMEQGRKEKYVNGIIRTLRAFFSFLEEEEYINKNPILKVKFIREEKVIIETFTDSEVKKLINAFDDSNFLSFRNKVIISLELDTGIRCTETCDIKDQDFMGDRMLVHGKGKKQRLVGISPPMKKLIKQYIKMRDLYFTGKITEENLFLSRTGRRLTVEAIERVYKVAQVKGNITRDIRVSPHTSRHTFAVNMLKNNDIYVVSKLLGHSSVKITETYLQSITNEKLLDRYEIKSPLQTIK